MKVRISLIIALTGSVFLTSQQSFAGKEGGGGTVILCDSQKLKKSEIFLLEFGNLHGWQENTVRRADLQKEKDWRKIVKTIISEINTFNPEMGAIFLKNFRTLESNTKFVPEIDFINDIGRSHFECYDGSLQKVSAKYYQAAIQDFDNSSLLINLSVWNDYRFDHFEKAGLLMHELLYKYVFQMAGYKMPPSEFDFLMDEIFYNSKPNYALLNNLKINKRHTTDIDGHYEKIACSLYEETAGDLIYKVTDKITVPAVKTGESIKSRNYKNNFGMSFEVSPYGSKEVIEFRAELKREIQKAPTSGPQQYNLCLSIKFGTTESNECKQSEYYAEYDHYSMRSDYWPTALARFEAQLSIGNSLRYSVVCGRQRLN